MEIEILNFSFFFFQRILTCKEFSSKSAVANLCWNPRLAQHSSRYILSGIAQLNDMLNRKNTEFLAMYFLVSEQQIHGNNFSNMRSAIVSNYAAGKVEIYGDRENKTISSEGKKTKKNSYNQQSFTPK